LCQRAEDAGLNMRLLSHVLIAGALTCTLAVAHAEDGQLIIPAFTDETQSAGINSIYAGDWQYMVGGGAATFDCNDDGYPDLYLAGGEGKAKFYQNASSKGGALKFEEKPSGLELDAVTGAYPIDIDSDGKTDLAV